VVAELVTEEGGRQLFEPPLERWMYPLTAAHVVEASGGMLVAEARVRR
jgi:hypothetical protein